jgi:hypothetical protein
MSNSFLTLAFGGVVADICDSMSGVDWAICRTIPAPVIAAIVACLLYAPLFACVNPPRLPLLGHLLGLVYLSIIAVNQGIALGYNFEKCAGDLVWVDAVSNLPIFVFLLALLGWFICRVIIDIANLSDSASTQETDKSYHMKYVRCLFARRKTTSVQQGGLGDILRFIWPYEKGFKYPLKFLGAMVVAITIMFELMYLTLYAAAFYDRELKPNLESILKNVSVEYNISVFNNLLQVIDGTLIVAPFVSSGLCLLLILHMARSLHIHMKLMARGQFKIKVHPNSHLWRLASSFKFFGYQIGFFVWAWLLYYGVAVFIGIMGYAVVKIDLLRTWLIVTPILALVWLGVVLGIIALCCKFIFLDKREPGARILSVTNRNVYNWFSYFFFIYTSIMGFVAAILRLLVSVLFGILLLFRLDRNVMMEGFEFADWGHRSYLGFLYVEHTHNNPIVHVFVSLMSGFQSGQPSEYRAAERRSLASGVMQPDIEIALLVSTKASSNSVKDDVGRVGKQKVRNRWLVAYTLLHNPSLRLLRAGHLREQLRVELRGDEEKITGSAPDPATTVY